MAGTDLGRSNGKVIAIIGDPRQSSFELDLAFKQDLEIKTNMYLLSCSHTKRGPSLPKCNLFSTLSDLLVHLSSAVLQLVRRGHDGLEVWA